MWRLHLVMQSIWRFHSRESITIGSSFSAAESIHSDRGILLLCGTNKMHMAHGAGWEYMSHKWRISHFLQVRETCSSSQLSNIFVFFLVAIPPIGQYQYQVFRYIMCCMQYLYYTFVTLNHFSFHNINAWH